MMMEMKMKMKMKCVCVCVCVCLPAHFYCKQSQYAGNGMPVAIIKLVEAVRPQLSAEGIFRLSAASSELETLRDQVSFEVVYLFCVCV